MGVLDSVLGTGAAGASGKNALKVAAVLGASELVRRSGGLSGLRDKMQNGGLGNVFGSWVNRGANQPVDPGHLDKAVGGGLLAQLAEKLGLPRDQAAAHLADVLPEVVDRATPDGRLPDDNDIPDDVARELSGLTHA